MTPEQIAMKQKLIADFNNAKQSKAISSKFAKETEGLVLSASNVRDMKKLSQMIEKAKTKSTKAKENNTKEAKATIKAKNTAHKKINMNVLFFREKTESDNLQRRRTIRRNNKEYVQVMAVFYVLNWMTTEHTMNIVKRYQNKFVTRVDLKQYPGFFNNVFNGCYTNFTGSDKLTEQEYDISHYIDAMIMYNVNDIEAMEEQQDEQLLGNDVNIDEILNLDVKQGIYSRYTVTEIIRGQTTFKDMIVDTQKYNYECFINAFIRCFKSYLKGSSDESIRKNLMYMMDLTDETVKQGISIKMISKAFAKYNFSLDVYDHKYNLVHTNNIKGGRGMRCMQKDNHIYLIDPHFKVIEPITHETATYEEDMSPRHLKLIDDVYMINTIDEITNILNEIMGREVKQDVNEVVCITNNDIFDLFLQCKQNGYEPKPIMTGKQFIAFKCFFVSKDTTNKINLLIKTSSISPRDRDIFIESVDEFKQMTSAYNNIYNQIFTSNYISHYNDYHKEHFNNYKSKPLYGIFAELKHKNVIEIDKRKCYRSHFENIKEIPTFNMFDRFEVYNGQKIEKLNLYICETDNVNKIFFQRRYQFVYGFIVKALNIPTENIKSFIRPSSIHKINVKNIINDTFKDVQLRPDVMKSIVNSIIGSLEKGTTEKCIINTFDTMRDVKRELKLNPKAKPFEVSADEWEEVEEYDEFEGKMMTKYNAKSDKKLYFTIESETIQFTSGFKYIKELLMQMYKFDMQIEISNLQSQGVKVYSIKTDALVIDEEHKDKVIYSDKIGGWRLEDKTFDDINLPTTKYEIDINEYVAPEPLPTLNYIQIDDERDTNEINNKIDEYDKVMITADIAGSGKSYIFKNSNYRVLFTTPTNKLALETKKDGFKCVTLDVLIGSNIFRNEFTKEFDTSEYDLIIFDEIYFHSINKLQAIYKYMLKNTDKKFGATGDIFQLETIEKSCNNVKKDYYEHCLSIMFPDRIHLVIPKRYDNRQDLTEEQKQAIRQKVINIKNEIFDMSINPMVTLKKYFKFVKEIKTKNNIVYENQTASTVSQYVRKKLMNRSDEFEDGERLVCRKRCTTDKKTLNVNYEYTLISYETLTIEDIESKERYEITEKQLNENFRSAHAQTCHSFQGCTIKGEAITIFDYHRWYVTRNWLYTAITRCDDLDNVYFYEYSSSGDYDQHIHGKYLEMKVNNYKEQDNKAKRSIDGDYVDVEFIKSLVGSTCERCPTPLTIDLYNGKIQSNLTLQRKDNNIAHFKSNCVGYCLNCNVQEK